MSVYPKLSIKNWAVDDRPREKLLIKGNQALSDAELLAILIGSGNRDESAVELSKKMLVEVSNNLNELGKKSIKDLTQFRGIGYAKAITIVAALELGKRRKMSEIYNRKKVTSSQDVFEYFQPFLTDLPHEEFYVLFLNKSNKILGQQQISKGGIASTIIDVKIILKSALESLASSIILAHNHPSGNTLPSDSDKKITQKLIDSASLIDVEILDHIILGDDKYFSFADKGLL